MNFLGSLIGDVLGVRKKRHRGALRFLTGGSGSMLKTSLLLGAAGIAWELFEARHRASGPTTTTVVEPSVTEVTQSTARVVGDEPARDDRNTALVVTRLLVCAARVDGELAEEELAHLVEHARAEGVEDRMRSEWQSPRPLAEIAGAIEGDAQRREAYTLAYACLRADEDVNGAEQIFLAQLAHHLRLDPETTARLEHEAAHGIDQAAGEETS